jgi:hypothetical protein
MLFTETAIFEVKEWKAAIVKGAFLAININ